MLAIFFRSLTLVVACLLLNQMLNQNIVMAQELPRLSNTEDKELTIHKITVLHLNDNLGGIYANVLKEHLISIIENNHKWEYVKNTINNPPIISELEENTEKTKDLFKDIDADGIITGQITKGSNGIEIILGLFKKEGSLLLSKRIKNYSNFDIANLKIQLNNLFQSMMNQLPYQGLVLSRHNDIITINLGLQDDIKENDELDIAQIINIKRHPKLSFLVNSEKTIIGRVRIAKAENTLSFATIIFEKEKNIIQKNSKVLSSSFISYEEQNTPSLSFGKNPKPWAPDKGPSYGSLRLAFGLGTYNYNLRLQNAGALSSSTYIYPAMIFGGEIWITSRWALELNLTQGIFSIPNPIASSHPSTLSTQIGSQKISLGYHLLADANRFDNNLILLVGLANYRTFIDASYPLFLTSTNYNGLSLGIRGLFSLTNKQDWILGGDFCIFLEPSLREEPKTSGSSNNNNINTFSLFILKKQSADLNIRGTIDFDLFASSFSGSGTRSNDAGLTSSQNQTLFSLGLNYLF